MEKTPTPPLKNIFSSVFSGEKKRTIKTKQVEEKPLTAESGTVAALGELVQQSNEISKVVVEAQNQQNYLLVELLKSIDGLKESGGLGGTVGASILAALAELTTLLMPAILGGTLAHFLDADESTPGNSIIGDFINENVPGAKTLDNFMYDKTGGLVGTSKDDPRYLNKSKLPDGTKEISGKLIEFEAGDINITAQEMTIRADEIVDNSDISGGGDAVAEGGGESSTGATPPQQGGGTTPSGKEADTTKISQSVSQLSDKVKGEFGDFRITSGFRDPIRNAAVGGARNSAHTRGNAIDVSFSNDIPTTLKFIEIASKAGAGGIGVYRPGSVHIDTEGRRAWGPDYHFGSVPQWAMPAIQKHINGGKENVPAMASGVLNLREAGPAITGEMGSEAIISKSGRVRQSGKGPVLRNLQKGDSVIPAAFSSMLGYDPSNPMSKSSYGSAPSFRTQPTYSSVPNITTRTRPTFSSVPGDRMPMQNMISGGESSVAATLIPQIIRLSSALNEVQQEAPKQPYYDKSSVKSYNPQPQYQQAYEDRSESSEEPQINMSGTKPPTSAELLYLYHN